MSYNDLFHEALTCFDNEDFDKAEVLTRQIAETAPNNPDILNLLGLIAQAKGIHEEACSYFSAAIRESKDNPSYFFNLAFSLKAIKQFSDALTNFFQVLKLAPSVKEAHNEIACIYEELNDIKQARQHWQFAIQMDSNYIIAKINLANSFRIDDINKAEKDLLTISDETPNFPLIWYDLAWLKYNQNDFSTALFFANKSAELAPNSDTIKYLQGLCFLSLNQEEQAKLYFTDAISINADNFDARLCLADILSRNNNFLDAEIHYKRLIELDNKNFATHSNYAEMLHRQNRLVEALEEYRKATIISPKSADISNNLGGVLKQLEDYDEALGLFFNALSLKPDLVAASINIWETLVLINNQDKEKALKIAHNWKKTHPNNLFASYAISALEGENIVNNQIFTEQLFDNFADNYEVVMQNLDYSAPLAIRRIAGALENRIVDLGCGSGFVGMAIKTTSNHLIGVDLSAKMLAKAAEKNIYSELVKADIIDFLNTRSDFDWIVASDVFCYIGDLEKLFSLCSSKNIIFTIETTDQIDKYQIQSTGRFKHNHIYIENLLQKNGFCDIYKEHLVLRKENNIPIDGYIFKALGKK